MAKKKDEPRHWVLDIPVRPRVMPRPRGKAGQRAYYPKPYREWRENTAAMLAAAWDEVQGGCIEGPVEVCIFFSPRSITLWIDRADRAWRSGLKGDIDNYAKAILDIMQQVGMIGDDRQVDQLHVGFAPDDQETE
jgi:Holliday junction resolvase RusA-like endonuclease